MRTLALAVLAAVLAAGCGGDDEAEMPPATDTETVIVTETETETTTETETDAGEAGTARCENEAAGYAIEYPADWHVNSGDVSEPCRFFDPEPIDVPEATDAIQFAIGVSREPAPFEAVTGDSPTRTVLEREELEIGGNPAVRLEFESTGEGLLGPGTRGYQYAIGVGDETIVATTYDVGELDYDRNREVLDAMMASIELAS